MGATELTVHAADKIMYQVDGESNSCQSCVITKDTSALQVMGTHITMYKEIGL